MFHVRFSALIFISLLLPAAAIADKRVALVIGNSGYAIAPLSNPRNDADDVAAALQRLHFQVTKAKDLDARQFDQTIELFEDEAKDADVALFFFSGHGVQIDKRGYLAPVDVKAESESSALRELVSVQDVVARVENTAKASIIVLDACRDSPLQERLRRVARDQRGMMPTKGLPALSVIGSNTLIVYATVPGEIASDGSGSRNSPFTAALLRHIETPGLEIELMFKRVTADVLRETRGTQQPERLSRLQGELVLAALKGEAHIRWPQLMIKATKPLMIGLSPNTKVLLRFVEYYLASSSSCLFPRKITALPPEGISQRLCTAKPISLTALKLQPLIHRSHRLQVMLVLGFPHLSATQRSTCRVGGLEPPSTFPRNDRRV